MNRKERRKQKREDKRARRTDPATKALLAKARASIEAGNLALAERQFRELTTRDPKNAEPFHMLALIAYQSGHLAEAGEMIVEATMRDDSDPMIHANCGAILNLLGRNMEAEAACRHAIQLAPDNPEAHNNLGVALDMQGKTDAAIEAVGEAITLKPDYGEAHVNLGNIRLRSGDVAGAIAAYEAAIAAAPRNAMAHANLGVALREAGRLEQAEASCRAAVRLNPKFAGAHNSLGNVLMAKGDLVAAEAAFLDAVKCQTGHQEARMNLAALLFHGGDAEGAEAGYQEVLEINPENVDALAGLGVVMLAKGRLDEAVTTFRKAVAIRPGHGEAQANLAAAVGGAFGDDEVAALRQQLAEKRVSDSDRAKLQFALADVLEQKGDAAGAFAAYAAGNALRKAWLEKGGRGFDADAYDRAVDAVIAAYDRRWFDRHKKGKGVSTDQPVFIVGMPRSGTTLVEQIAASHPKVAGRGEIDLIRALAGDAAAAASRDDAGLKAMAATYLDRLRMDADQAIRITDKTPFNFLYLGLIQVLFPNARAVHCVRDPLDTGFSCFRQNFAAPHAWACDLADIGRTMRAYRRLMDHWKKVLTLPMLEIRYEELIDNQKRTSQGLIEFLGLQWDDACMKFHKSGRAVLTASNWQVRKPLYDTAVGKAKRYEKFLGPLKAGLGG